MLSKMDRWSKLKSGQSTGELTFARFAVAAARAGVTFKGPSACHSVAVQEFSNGKMEITRLDIVRKLEDCEPAKSARDHVESYRRRRTSCLPVGVKYERESSEPGDTRACIISCSGGLQTAVFFR